MVYDALGNELIENETKKARFEKEIQVLYDRDETTGCFYTMVLIPQTNKNGEKQYPFVYWPNYPNGGNESTLQMNRRKKTLVAINAGRFKSPYGPGVTITGLPLGTVIQNSAVLQQGASGNYVENVDKVLTIDNVGHLGYADCLDSAANLVSNGVVSAVSGFIPILVNYENIEDVDASVAYITNTADSQRQVIGQYNNGDYIIISSEGRGYQGGNWFTVKQLQTLCKQLGVKDAFVLDGGGSMETVVGNRQLNPIYDNELGRVVPTYIVFNGSDTFDL